jgi:hypothetical protein
MEPLVTVTSGVDKTELGEYWSQPPKLSSAEFWPLAGATDIRDNEPFSRHSEIPKNGLIVPTPGRRNWTRALWFDAAGYYDSVRAITHF